MFVAHCCDTLKTVSANQFAIFKCSFLSFVVALMCPTTARKEKKKILHLCNNFALFLSRVHVIMVILLSNLDSVFPIIMLFVVI